MSAHRSCAHASLIPARLLSESTPRARQVRFPPPRPLCEPMKHLQRPRRKSERLSLALFRDMLDDFR
jgi:hypothetical protein